MILVEPLYNLIGIEIIITAYLHTSISSPPHILSSPTKILIIVAQTQDQSNLVLSCLPNHKIKRLHACNHASSKTFKTTLIDRSLKGNSINKHYRK